MDVAAYRIRVSLIGIENLNRLIVKADQQISFEIADNFVASEMVGLSRSPIASVCLGTKSFRWCSRLSWDYKRSTYKPVGITTAAID